VTLDQQSHRNGMGVNLERQAKNDWIFAQPICTSENIKIQRFFRRALSRADKTGKSALIINDSQTS
jgi:hypothetical protein